MTIRFDSVKHILAITITCQLEPRPLRYWPSGRIEDKHCPIQTLALCPFMQAAQSVHDLVCPLDHIRLQEHLWVLRR